MALLNRWKALLPFIFAALLAGCAPITRPAIPTSIPTIGTTIAATPITPAAIATLIPAFSPTVPPPTRLPTAPPSTPTAIPPTASSTPVAARQTDVIQAVIQQANDAQARAFNQHQPALMKDTATSDYYTSLLQINSDLATNGVSAIRLLKLEWGPVNLTGATTAEATTYETWQTVFSEGGVERDRDRNVYQLVFENGAWKIQSDDHPDSGAAGNTAPLPTSTPGAQPTPPEQIVPAGPGQSRNWSGYAADGGSFTAVSGTWSIPEPKSTNVEASAATWVGIGGVQSRDLIQAGTEEIILGPSSVRYNAWIEMLPDVSHTVPLSVYPGDSITVSIARQSGGDWLITILDNTTGQSYKNTVTYRSSLSSAEWVEEAPSGGRRIVPLEDFGQVSISGATATENGKTVTIAQAGGKPITMIDARREAIAQTSKLGSDGKSFTVTRVGPAPQDLPAPSRRGRSG